jgi:hypothetical protein
VNLLLLLACIDGRVPVEVAIDFEPVVPTSTDVAEGSLVFETFTVTVSNLRLLGAPDPLSAWRPSLMAAAYAHPGHEFAGAVRAELLGEHTLDAVGEPQPLGVAGGFSGDVVAARIELYEAHVTGRLETADGVLPFDVFLPLDRPLPGLDLSASLVPERLETFTLAFDADAALAFVEWSDENGDGRLDGADERFFNTFVFGVSSLDAWSLEHK